MGMKIEVVFFFFVLPLALADLRVGFYNSSCPQAESIVRGVVHYHFTTDKSITAALLRMHFHDCFVRVSFISFPNHIHSTDKNQSEKDAGPNFTVRGYELIDKAKNALEAACPLVVSCADIITIATRYAVALAGGPSYVIPTERQGGLVSDPSEINLPGPTFPVSKAFQNFQSKNLSLNDMATRLGAHAVGVAHCNFFVERLSDFQGTGSPDPSMDPALAAKLRQDCSMVGDTTAFLDQNSSFVVDNQYYKEILLKRGILQIDQEFAKMAFVRICVEQHQIQQKVYRCYGEAGKD
ncbi:hypothetical protein SLEP1_g39353 [Rubroshorea leprosula]|uniref:Peroxidase n=1 Tax=Rubroshorea leprosula TaxID=152421 RepID=A0AAV5L129_9ROSI|nr:hypothetical protein SLEP1_g39353 [Rubroshorea leprosula]